MRRANRLATDPIREADSPIIEHWLGEVPYRQTWDEQAAAAQARAKDEIQDQLWTLTHPPVYTAGRQTQPSDLPDNGFEVVEVDRGGRITWHGPGQLVCYPIVKLALPLDVVAYVRRMEEAIIAVCREFGLSDAGRVPGRTGVWLPGEGRLRPQRKLAAIGVRVTRRVTMHGLALNCNNTLAYYDHIVPCGIDDADVTTMSIELGREVSVDEVRPVLVPKLVDAFDGRLPVSQADLDH